MHLRYVPQGAFVQHDTTEPISTERKEIRTINGNLSEQPESKKKKKSYVMAGGPPRSGVAARLIALFQSVLMSWVFLSSVRYFFYCKYI